MTEPPQADRPRPVFAALREVLQESRPAALATVTAVEAGAAAAPPATVTAVEAGAAAAPPAGTKLGAKLLVEPAPKPAAGAQPHQPHQPPRPSILGSLGDPDLDRVVARDALAAVESGITVTRHYGPHGEARQTEIEVFIEVFAPPPRMVIFGAVDFTGALASVGRLLGFYVVVCDARAVFATPERFPSAHEVVVEWPDRYLARVGGELGPRDAVCVLTHDTKFDVPAVTAALATRVGYLGAMGSRRTHNQRWQRLVETGVEPGELAERLMSPIGLDIGARTPEETAVAICAEIIACRTGAAVPSLRTGDGPIHSR